jgi:2'-5' RNA ligase
MPRIFVAVDLPFQLKKSLVKVQERLRKLPLKAKWVEEPNLHITLIFLGEKNMDEIRRIKKILRKFCQKFESEIVRIEKIKLIPNENWIRVIAFEVFANELKRLQKELVERIDGDAKDLHLTLGRVKNVFDKNEVIRQTKLINFKAEFKVEEITLFESKLSPKGPNYIVIEKFPLAKSSALQSSQF